MPAFWGYPPPPHDYPYHWVILDPKSKVDKVKVTNLKNSPKFQIVKFWNKHCTRHTFWSCLISKYTSIPPFNFVEAGGITRSHNMQHTSHHICNITTPTPWTCSITKLPWLRLQAGWLCPPWYASHVNELMVIHESQALGGLLYVCYVCIQSGTIIKWFNIMILHTALQ